METDKYYQISKQAAILEEVETIKKILLPTTNPYDHTLQSAEACKTLAVTDKYAPLKPMPYMSTALTCEEIIVAGILGRMKAYLHREGADPTILYDFFKVLRNIFHESKDSQKELWLILIFNLSRAFIDPDLMATQRARTILVHSFDMRHCILTSPQTIYFTFLHNFFKSRLKTKAVENGLLVFLKAIGVPLDKLPYAIKIGETMKIQYLTGIGFCGMVGFGRTIYLSVEDNYTDVAGKKESMQAYTVENIFHEYGHVLVREMIECDFGTLTPRELDPKANAIEGGYRMEQYIFGGYNKCIYAQPHCKVVMGKARWNEPKPLFTTEELDTMLDLKSASFMFSGICPLCWYPTFKQPQRLNCCSLISIIRF
eukprot:TRINITY_DN43286_c1_g1_i1.p1 TRINITY_DN43286_c1_g1~~TRINITY_DN43286_c1_g1_i1.p1  ORF type:complete len:420 (-),score=21.17 TRINITY_DN43286_c1_g1_i1:52-1161(-)